MQHPSDTSPACISLRSTLPVLALLTLLLGTAGCVYRINIQQGNFLDPSAIEQVVPGMARSQVRFLLGTPMVGSAFDSERWDYVYYLKRGRQREASQRKVTVFFEGDRVTRVERPDADSQVARSVAPATAPPAPAEPGN